VRSVLLSFSLAAVLLLSSCQKSITVGVNLDSKLSSYVPPASTLLAGADVDGLKSTPFYARHQNQLNVPALHDMAEQIGVDPRRDLASVLVAWQTGSPVILARGRFDSGNVEPHLVSLGSKRSEHRKQAVFVKDGQSLFFPEKHIAIGGPSPAIRDLIDRKDGGVPQPLVDRLRQLPKSDQVWIVSSQGLPLARIPMRSDVESALSNIVAYVSGVNAGITFDEGAHLHADLRCISPEDARQVHDALRGGIGLARLTTKDNQLELLKLYDAIQVSYEQQTVHVRADLSAQLADQLLGLMSGFDRRAGELLSR
jgi:hypothetical protein